MSLRALVLAAGRGERLRPLTEFLPKPLLPVLGESVLERTLERLAAAGVDAAAINLHHLGEMIPPHLGEDFGELSLVYSPEAELLGTLGPHGSLRGFFAGSDPVLQINGDSLCRWPVTEVLEAHHDSGARATLLLSSRADPGAFGGGVEADPSGWVRSFRGGSERGADSRYGVFAGFHCISPGLLADIEAAPSDIVRDLYEPLLRRGERIHAVFTDRRWHDLGTPRRYLDGVLDELRATGGNRAGWRHDTALVAGGTEIVGSALESGAEIAAGATITRSLVLPAARVGTHAMVDDSIVGPGVVLPTDCRVESILVTRGRAGELHRTPL